MSIQVVSTVSGHEVGEVDVFPESYYELTDKGQDKEAEKKVFNAKLHIESLSDTHSLNLTTPNGMMSIVLSHEVLRNLILQVI